jgi:(4S)-4-hydroxy-5-phosphonooxypentane-2,3-dione isomerase
MNAPHQHGDTPYAITVEFEVEPTAFPDFLRLVKDNAAQSVKNEVGCTRFDVLTPAGQHPQRTVLLYEIYVNRAAFDVHLASAHFLSFDQATKTMVTRKTVADFAVFENAKPNKVLA